MRTLSGITNTDAPSSDYPGGRIRNKDNTAIPPIPGTPIIEQLYGDIVQFFQRLLVLGSVTANNLADNVTNGYQTITALWNAILGQFAASDGATQTGTATNLFVTPGGLSSRTATETRTGIAELASTEEVLAGTDAQRIITPAGLREYVGQPISRVITMIEWDMDATPNITFNSTIAFDKFINAKAWIKNNLNNRFDNLEVANFTISGAITCTDDAGQADINFFRANGGYFDNASFNSAECWILIEYYP